MTKTNTERTLETLVEFAAVQKTSLDRLTESIQTTNENLSGSINLLTAGLDTLTARVDTIAVQVAGFGSGMNELKGLSRQILQAIDSEREVAKQQADNVAQLIELAKQQQTTVDRLLGTVTK